MKAKIVAYRKTNTTGLGKAPVNSYNRLRTLRISLNAVKVEQDTLDDDAWAGVMAHEFLHNLGWGHPDGEYTLAMPIEIYQACISGGHHLDVSFLR